MGQGDALTAGTDRQRRALLASMAALAAGCDRTAPVTGGFAGASHERGHLLRQAAVGAGAATPAGRTQVLILGAGVAGLAAARALRQRGIEDFVLLELEDQAGGNSRATQLQGIACPLAAHYLPVPGDAAREVQELLEELGLRRRVAGRWTYDERHLCHSPQERLYFNGRWQDGLLPTEGVGPQTLAQYRAFAQEVDAASRAAPFALPRAGRTPAPSHLALDAQTFAAWLAARGLSDPQLLWYLDYCCRDDYGVGPAQVSAWAGLHYFAARHGFQPPGTGAVEREAVLTWPEGNAWLAGALARPLGDRVRGGQVVLRVAEQRHGVEVDAFDSARRQRVRWQADRCIVALPAFVAARVVENPPDALRQRAARTRYAPWLVANLHLRAPLHTPRGGSPLAWDNVIYGSAGLGYVVATHQSLNPMPGPTVLTWYLAPGEAQRAQLLERPWAAWRDLILAELAGPHPELPKLVTQVEVARYGHAMAIPVPGTLALGGPPAGGSRLAFAHADWAGYSIFEEAFTLGHRAGLRA
jgi:monoamine oxidase